jgi:hypothetical protein
MDHDRSSALSDPRAPTNQPSLPNTAGDETGYATRRWVEDVLMVVRSIDDVPTSKSWSHTAAHSEGSLKRHCKACGLSTSSALRFARALRIVVRYSGRRNAWWELLTIVDPDAMHHFLERAGFAVDEPVPTLEVFLARQRFIDSSKLVAAVTSAITPVAPLSRSEF